MTKEELDTIKENVYMRCEVATIAKIGITPSDEAVLKLIDEVDRLNNLNKKAVRIIDKFKETYIICFDKPLWSFVKQLEKCLKDVK